MNKFYHESPSNSIPNSLNSQKNGATPSRNYDSELVGKQKFFSSDQIGKNQGSCTKDNDSMHQEVYHTRNPRDSILPIENYEEVVFGK